MVSKQLHKDSVTLFDDLHGVLLMAVFIYFERSYVTQYIRCMWHSWTTDFTLLTDSVVVAGAKTVTGYFQVGEYWDALNTIVAALHGRDLRCVLLLLL